MAQWICIGRGLKGTQCWDVLKQRDGVSFLEGPPSSGDLEGGELVIEASVGSDRKETVLKALADCGNWRGPVASLVERDSATHLATGSGIRESFVGFIAPSGAGKRGAIELLRGEITDTRAIDLAANAFKELGLVVTICRDQAGGILSRALASMINEAAVMAQNHVASLEKIDQMMRLAANFPMGPFEWADKIGLDRLLGLLETLTREFGPMYQPCPMIRRKVEAGKLGVKTGEGFYQYGERDAT